MPVLLAGCGLPSALTVVTTFADGVSNVVSGRGMADHALSAFTASDCAIIRVLDERDICTDYGGEEMPRVLMASAPEVGSWARVENSVTSGLSVAGGARIAPLGAPSDVPRLQPALFATTMPEAKSEAAIGRDDRVTVLGSYRNRDNAENALARLESLQPRIVTASVGEHAVYRVVSDVPVPQARAVGIDDAWSVRHGGSSPTNL